MIILNKKMYTEYTTSYQDLDSIAGEMPSLKQLNINCCYNLDSLSMFHELESLKITFCSHEFDQSQIVNLANLSKLILCETTIDINNISDLTKLTSLELNCTQFGGIDKLCNFTELEELSISSLNKFNLDKLDFKYLEKLYLAKVAMIDLSLIRGLQKLKSLSVVWSDLSCINDINDFYNLELLNIKHNKVEDVIAIRDLTKLKSLNIDDNPIIEKLQLKTAFELLDMGITPLMVELIFYDKKPDIVDDMKAIVVMRSIKSA